MRTGAITQSKHAGEIPRNKQKAPGPQGLLLHLSNMQRTHAHTIMRALFLVQK